MNDFLTSTVLGIVEGLTEFLPVSSTGHLLITEHWLGARSETFNIFIQLGAVLAVTLLYWRKIVGLVIGIRRPENFSYLLKLAVAFALTSIFGLAAKKAGWKLPDQLTPVLIAVFAGAIWIFLAEGRLRSLEPTSRIGWMTACAVGIAQVLAGVFPGLSRSGATILTALLFGVERPAAFHHRQPFFSDGKESERPGSRVLGESREEFRTDPVVFPRNLPVAPPVTVEGSNAYFLEGDAGSDRRGFKDPFHGPDPFEFLHHRVDLSLHLRGGFDRPAVSLFAHNLDGKSFPSLC